MSTAEFLSNIRVASPCSARWEDMAGDDRTRFCAHCQKHVYHLSRMTAEEAAALIRTTEGTVCTRFYRRKDGTVLTSDCPVGAARLPRRLKRLVLAAVPLLVAVAVVNVWARGHENGSGMQARSRLSDRLNAAVWKVKTWLGISPPAMGGTCAPRVVAPPPSPAPAPTPSGKAA